MWTAWVLFLRNELQEMLITASISKAKKSSRDLEIKRWGIDGKTFACADVLLDSGSREVENIFHFLFFVLKFLLRYRQSSIAVT